MSNNVTAPNSYFTGATGEAIIQSIFGKWKISSSKIGESDFGEDFLCDIFIASDDDKTNIRTNLTFRAQVKTTKEISSKGYIRRTKNGFSFSLKTSLLKLWCESYYPVILVIWDLTHESGYWCVPLDEFNANEIPKQETVTIRMKKENSLIESEKQIKDYVQSYYNGILRIGNSQYQCYIYPVWMPKYRIFTSIELNNSFKENPRIKQLTHLSDYLPSFLASYNNINLNGGFPCISFTNGSDSLSEYLLQLKQYLIEASIEPNDNEWIAYILSPIEIVAKEEYRVINQMTDWTCFSLIDNQFVTDRNYTFDVGNKFYYTQRVRASSDSQNLFINNNGDFAIEIFATGYSLFSRKSYDLIKRKLYRRAFCIWDITNCNSSEKIKLAEWCANNHYLYGTLENNSNYIIISHEFFSVKEYGSILPGAALWSEFDNYNLSSFEFASLVPYGMPAKESDSEQIINRYLNSIDKKLSDEVFIQYEQILNGEVLNHNERLIHFISYIHPINPKEFESWFETTKQDFKMKLLQKMPDSVIFVDFFKGIANLVINVKPPLNMSTKRAVELVSPIFIQIIEIVKPYCHDKGNMAYKIKYKLDRHLPEKLVVKY